MRIVLVCILLCFSAWGKEHPIYDQILRNKPKINKKYAMKLSNVIHKMSVKYKIPKEIYTAILAQESEYVLNSKNCFKGYVELKNGEDIQYTETRLCTDYGISQMNYRNIEKMKLDIHLLLTDLEYSVEQGAKVLRWAMLKYKDKEDDWYTRYHSGTRVLRDIYKPLVDRYL